MKILRKNRIASTLAETAFQGDRPGLMTKEIENPKNAVERSVSGGFTAMWRGRTVYENGRVKKFETEEVAHLYLNRCDEAGKIIR